MVTEHTSRAVRDDVIANAPGRFGGRCEHLDLPVVRSRDGRRGALLDANRVIERRRETRHGVCTVAARATAITHRASPLEAGLLLRVLLEETREIAAHDVNRALTACGEGQLRAPRRLMHCT